MSHSVSIFLVTMSLPMSTCLFCKIVAKEIPAEIVYEDERVLGFLDIHPVNPGHTLLIPKRHSDAFAVTPAEDIAAIMAAAQKIASAILKATGADAFNFAANNGKAAGQLIPHTHFHFIPRLSNDGYKHWHGPEGKPDFALVGAGIRKELQAQPPLT